MRLHAFTDDALGDHDAVALAALIRDRKVSRGEVLDASLARAEAVAALDAIEVLDPRATRRSPAPGAFSGVPTFIKDNTDLAGLPTLQGSEAITAHPAKRDAGFTRTFLSTGVVPLGKSRLPEFGFSASTEFMTRPPVRNPWSTEHSSGASSGGSGVLVASGVVPIAHANDGGGSIRIPAACNGLVGLKPSRGRFAPAPLDRVLPVQLAVEGVLTRTVRDTAHLFAETERTRRYKALPPIGLVEGPGDRRLRIGLVLDSVIDAATDAETKGAVNDTATLLASLGHEVVPLKAPMDEQFAEDFELYWGMLAYLAVNVGGRTFAGFDPSKLDTLTVGLGASYRRNARRTPGVIARLRRSPQAYAAALSGYDAVLSPVLAHTTPLLGHLSPQQPFEELFRRLLRWVAFTPLNNATGSPAISLPMGQSSAGLPIGVQVMAGLGQERVLLELAYELEAAQPFARITQPVGG